jgi:hypothetical protein
MQSVFAGKVRTRHISTSDFHMLRARFLTDISRRKILVVRLFGFHFQAAEKLIHHYGPTKALRTLDSLQLAVALDLRAQGLITNFVCADRNLCIVAQDQGLSTINPEEIQP